MTDSFGATGTDDSELKIFINEPAAAFTAVPNPCACNQSVSFDASGSMHGRPDRTIVKYEWDFDYLPDNFSVDAVGPTASHSYSQFGSYTVALRVTDDNVPPRSDEASLVVNVNQGNLAPVADSGGIYEIPEGSGLTLDGSSSTDPNAACGDRIVAWNWDLDGDGLFDDGTGAQLELTPQAMRDLGLADGPVERTIQLRVTDTFGATAVASGLIRVANVAPALSNVQTTSPVIDEGQFAHLTGAISEPGILDPLTLTIDWGDGGAVQKSTWPQEPRASMSRTCSPTTMTMISTRSASGCATTTRSCNRCGPRLSPTGTLPGQIPSQGIQQHGAVYDSDTRTG